MGQSPPPPAAHQASAHIRKKRTDPKIRQNSRHAREAPSRPKEGFYHYHSLLFLKKALKRLLQSPPTLRTVTQKLIGAEKLMSPRLCIPSR